MKFSVIYHNSEVQRKVVLHILPQMLNDKLALDKKVFQTNFFTTRPTWPALEHLHTIPFHIQVEEFLFRGQKLTSLRKLVIDVEQIGELLLSEKTS